jgi:hypothetical protein
MMRIKIFAIIISIAMLSLSVCAEAVESSTAAPLAALQAKADVVAATPEPSFFERIMSMLGFGGERRSLKKSITVVPSLGFSVVPPSGAFGVEEVDLEPTLSWSDLHIRGSRWDVVGSMTRPFVISMREPLPADSRGTHEYGAAKSSVGGTVFLAIPPYDGETSEVLLRLIAAEVQGCPIHLSLESKSRLDGDGMVGASEIDRLRIEEARSNIYFVDDRMMTSDSLIDAGRYFFVRDAMIDGARCGGRSANSTLKTFRQHAKSAEVDGWNERTFMRIPANNMEINLATAGGVIRGGWASNGTLGRSVRGIKKYVSPRVFAFFPEKGEVLPYMNDFFRFYFMQKMWCQGDVRYVLGELDESGWCSAVKTPGYGVLQLQGAGCGEAQVICDDLGNPNMPCIPKDLPNNCFVGMPGGSPNSTQQGDHFIACPQYVHFGASCHVEKWIKDYISTIAR